MAYATEKAKVGREPTWIVELDLDTCSLTYGVGACTAAGAAGSECYNTRSTCQDPTNYARTTKTYRFSEPRSRIPPSAGAVPCIRSVDVSATKITEGQGLGHTGKVTVTFHDFPHHDRGIDPYVATRTYDPEAQGTFWRKLRARNPYYSGRIMRVKSGYIADTFSLDDFVTRTYIIESISGPDASGLVTVTGKDLLKLADDDRAKAPAANTGYLAANIVTAGWTGDVDLEPAGIGNTEYSASGTIRIGSECLTFTRAADTLTITARGTDGTTADTHAAGDAVQECLRYTDARVDDIQYDQLVNYAPVPAAYITKADWTAEVDDWIPGCLLSALITEPTGVRKLVDEVCVQAMCDVWWSALDAKVKLKVLAPLIGAITQYTETDNVLADSLTVKEEAGARLTQVWVFYDVINPTEPLDEPKNFRKCEVYQDADSEGADEHGDVRVRRIFSRWITSSGDALRLGSRTLSRFRDAPRQIRFKLDMADTAHWVGDTVELVTSKIVDAAGADDPKRIYILETKEVMGGHAVLYVARESMFRYRYARFAPGGTPDYTAATDEQRERYGFFCDGGTVLMSDGSDPYVFV